MRLSAGGRRVRVRLSNATGLYPLVIGAAHIAKPATGGSGGAIDPASDHALTFGGMREVTIAPGAEVVSDPVATDLTPLSTVGISLFVPRWTGPSVIHNDGVTTSYIVDDADATAEAALTNPRTSHARFFIDEVDVEAPGQPGAVVTLGDSITDGYHSEIDANHRWPDRLEERLLARENSAPVGVVNAGSAATASCTTIPRTCSARARSRGSTATCLRHPTSNGSCSRGDQRHRPFDRRRALGPGRHSRSDHRRYERDHRPRACSRREDLRRDAHPL
jgi:hypothetical protein